MTIGLVGLGKMGSAIAARLKDVGADLVCWDASAIARDRAAATGVKVLANARAVADAADTIISIITDDEAVRGIFHGPAGFLEADIAGKFFIEMTTLRPATVRDLAAAVEAKGARLVDAPVLGTLPSARSGELFALVGGTDEDFGHASQTLAHITGRREHMGPVSAGSTMKLVVNLGMAAQLEVLAEGLAMGSREGLSVDAMLDVLSAGIMANGWMKAKMPILRGEGGDMTLDVRSLRKDVQSALATGTAHGVPMPSAAGILATLSAAVAAGEGLKDHAEVARFLREKMIQKFD